MKKCPKCFETDEDTTRYCSVCGAEMFFEYRFGSGSKVKTDTQVKNYHAPYINENPEQRGIVVFIHGYMGSPRQFDKLSDAVYQQGYTVAGLLLPGHGGSLKDFSSSTYKQWQSHVNSEVEKLSKSYKNIWLVGHSMGGLLAINAAVKHSKFVRGLFLMACPFKLTFFSVYATKIRAKQLFGRKNNPIKAAYIDNSGVPRSFSIIWRTIKPYSQFKKLMHTANGNLANINSPVTAVYSASDELVSMKSRDILQSKLHKAALELVILADSLHAYYPEREQEVIIRNFIDMITG